MRRFSVVALPNRDCKGAAPESGKTDLRCRSLTVTVQYSSCMSIQFALLALALSSTLLASDYGKEYVQISNTQKLEFPAGGTLRLDHPELGLQSAVRRLFGELDFTPLLQMPHELSGCGRYPILMDDLSGVAMAGVNRVSRRPHPAPLPDQPGSYQACSRPT